MNKKGIIKPNNAELPLWAWHTFNGKTKKPDFRRIGLGVPGKKYACIEFEISEKDTLLSDFDLWHFVLNDMWLTTCSSEKEFDEKYEKYKLLSPKEQKTVKLGSWQEIFNVKNRNEYITTGQYIQATFWELRKDMIRDIKYFVAK